MRNMKKWLATALALVMVFAMAACAVADTYSITINNSATGHTYEAYQIFAGDLSGTTLSNIVWGSGISETGKTALQDKYDTAETKSAAGVAAKLTSKTLAEEFADEVAKYLTTAAGSANTVSDGKYVISGLAAGYYLVKDQDKSQANANDAYTAFILKVVKDATVTPKTGVPEVVKKVKDTNDSVADSTTGWQDSADYDIGDTIPYQLTATLGDLTYYDHYYVEFVDKMTNLTYTGITSVKVGDTTLNSDQYSVAWNADTKTLNVTILDVKKYNAAEGTKVIVEYNATLDSTANIGSTGNPNEVYLKFTNNPNNTGDGTTKPSETGETPKDKNIVFTYKVTANKVTSDKTALPGAAFELFKKNADGTYKSLGLVGATKNADGTYTVDANTTTFSWTGIDDGEYKIVEVVTPAGYNSVSDIVFTVTADHVAVADNPTLTSLNGGNAFTGEVSTGTLTTEIINLAGTELPSTGGMGTTVLYVGGGVLVLAAVVLLIAKRRSNA